MKKYTVIPIEVTKLILPDIYRFTCLTFTPRKDGYTDSTFEQLKDITEDNSIHTIKDFVERLKESAIIQVQTVVETGLSNKIVRRNKYYIPNYQHNFRRIDKSFLNLNLDMSEKGFLIGLFTVCYNNTRICKLKQKEIALKLNISKSTVSTYIKNLTNKGYIDKIDKGYKINIESFLADNRSSEQLLKIEQLKQYELFAKILDKTIWEHIRNVDKYLLAIESGTLNRKRSKEEINEIWI